jgi:hypothetical protein
MSSAPVRHFTANAKIMDMLELTGQKIFILPHRLFRHFINPD